MQLTLGPMHVQVVSGGRLRLDGGAMFGVVPRPVWERRCPPDEHNRIAMDTNCLLIRTADRTVLVDTGYGMQSHHRQRRHHALEDGHPLLRNLAAVGVGPEQVDTVILTHLHFDHAGGCTRIDGAGQRQLSFPRAEYVVQRSEWEDATADLPELAGSYQVSDFLATEEAGRLRLIDGEAELLPGLVLRPTGGHTRGHQMLVLGEPGDGAIYPVDVCPTSAHLRTAWTMAYDQFPREVRRLKPQVLGQAADEKRWVLFAHDPRIKAARIGRDERREFAVRE